MRSGGSRASGRQTTILQAMALRRSSKAANTQQRTDPEAARTAAVALLARRDFASAELRVKLCSKGFEDAAAGQAIAELATRGVLDDRRSEEHTSELQSRLHLVCRLLLEKKYIYDRNSITS